MKPAILLVSLVMLTGCAIRQPAPPMSVQAMPNDCANRTAIINWLTREANAPQHTLESKEMYERSRAEIRAKIWTVRYNCQPV
jgi:hypothetical protein